MVVTLMYDVIIVGGGPVGLFSARLIEKKLNVLVLEKNKTVGHKACSGLISPNLKSFIPIKKRFLDNIVKSAILHLPFNKIIELEKKEGVYVINRKEFSDFLLSRLKSHVRFESKVDSLKMRKDSVEAVLKNGNVKSKMIIGCDGANSVVRNHFNVVPNEMVNGIAALKEEENYDDFVEIWLDVEKLKDGFFWKIPRGENTEYGAFGTVNFEMLEKFFGIKNYKRNAAPIPIGPVKSYFQRVILLGDAAGVAKPWSGGGIIYGFTCAQAAEKIISKAFEKGLFTENFLKQYEDLWKERLWKNISAGMFFRDVLKHSTNKWLYNFAEKMSIDHFDGIDMDFPF